MSLRWKTNVSARTTRMMTTRERKEFRIRNTEYRIQNSEVERLETEVGNGVQAGRVEPH
jgi:hypothetical protein